MASHDEDIIYSDDYTRVVVYQSRQFTLGDLSLAAINGLQWDALPRAIAVAFITAVPAGLLLLLLGLSPWIAVLVFPVPLLIVYTRTAKERVGGLTEREKAKLRSNFRSRQPRELLGLSTNTEPTSFTWTVILYTPAR